MTDGEKIQNKIALLCALLATDEISAPFKVLPLGTKNTGFCMKAALCVFDNGLTSSKPPTKRLKDSVDNYIEFFKTDTWKEMKEGIPALIDQFYEGIKTIQRTEAEVHRETE